MSKRAAGKVEELILNPLLIGTEAPPIPEAKAWASAYDGALGPLIDLSQAVPGYPPHPDMLARLGGAAATREAASYGDIAGDADLRASYGEHVSGLYRSRIGPDQVAITAGCNLGFVMAMMALAGAGDAVMLPCPWYFNHKMALDMLGIETVAIPCRAENGLVPHLRDAERALVDRVRAVVLVTPNNPTGAVYPPATIAAFHAFSAERRIALVIDETYRDFLPSDAPPHSLFAEAGGCANLIQLYSFSKSYCIPGHRVGALVAEPEAVGEVAKILDTLQICAPRTPQLVLPWAIPALADWRSENRAEIARRAGAFRAAIAAVDGWEVVSIGAYFAYVRHPYDGRRGAEICEWMARERGVLWLPGAYFGPGQEAFIRVAFANVDAAGIAELPARLSTGHARHARTGKI